MKTHLRSLDSGVFFGFPGKAMAAGGIPPFHGQKWKHRRQSTRAQPGGGGVIQINQISVSFSLGLCPLIYKLFNYTPFCDKKTGYILKFL